MRRYVIVIAGSAFVLAVVVIGIVLLWGRGAAGADSSDTAQTASIAVQVVLPRQGGLERTVTRPGTVHAFQYANLYAKTAGYLHDQVVDIGDRVKKNQVLVEVYAPELATDVQKAAAGLKKAKAQIRVMGARVQAATAEVQEAKVKVEQTQEDLLNAVAVLKLRGEQYQRIKRLVESRSVEQKLADEKLEAKQAAQSKERAQRKAVETAKVAVTTAKARQVAAEADSADAEAQVAVAQAALAHAQVFQAYTKIRAPFDGVITRRSYHEGDFIHEGGGNGGLPILTIARTDLMRVIVNVPDPDVPFTHRGEQARLRISSLPGQVFTGTVARPALSEAFSSRTMRTEIDLRNPKDVLTEGMFGSVTIRLGADPHALTIPTACLVGPEQDGERAVYVVRQDQAHRVKVHVRRDDGIHAEIDPTLDPHEPLVVSHAPGLHDSAAVAVQQP